jgi:nicotinamidase-related amidase
MQENIALLVMDVQSNIINQLENKDEYVQSVQKAVDHAHDLNIPIIFIVVGFREGMPEVSANNKVFATIKKSSNQDMINPEPAIKPSAKDILITKKRFSAFSGSDLEVTLRSLNIKKMILCGVSTSGVVLSTLREAADKDFELSIIEDLCKDSDPEVHRVLVDKVFPRQAEIITLKDWLNKNT